MVTALTILCLSASLINIWFYTFHGKGRLPLTYRRAQSLRNNAGYIDHLVIAYRHTITDDNGTKYIAYMTFGACKCIKKIK